MLPMHSDSIIAPNKTKDASSSKVAGGIMAAKKVVKKLANYSAFPGVSSSFFSILRFSDHPQTHLHSESLSAVHLMIMEKVSIVVLPSHPLPNNSDDDMNDFEEDEDMSESENEEPEDSMTLDQF